MIVTKMLVQMFLGNAYSFIHFYGSHLNLYVIKNSLSNSNRKLLASCRVPDSTM